MSNYTTEVRFIVESSAGLVDSTGFNKVEDIIGMAVDKIFNFDFPIFDEAYRRPLCIKILRHYYTREICAETVGLWKLWLCNKLNEIMPYYNQLYKSELLTFNPLYDVDYTRKYEKKGDENRDTNSTTEQKNSGSFSSESNSTNSGVSRNMFSDTPQGALDNVENETYLTNATKVTQNDNGSVRGSGSSNGSNDVKFNEGNKINSTEDYLEKVSGKTASRSYANMLEEYRKTFLNIDKMVIEELSSLFFGLW